MKIKFNFLVLILVNLFFQGEVESSNKKGSLKFIEIDFCEHQPVKNIIYPQDEKTIEHNILDNLTNVGLSKQNAEKTLTEIEKGIKNKKIILSKFDDKDPRNQILVNIFKALQSSDKGDFPVLQSIIVENLLDQFPCYKISLQGFTKLTTAFFSKLDLGKLNHLTLNNCPVTIEDLNNIARKAVLLENLSLISLPHLAAIEQLGQFDFVVWFENVLNNRTLVTDPLKFPKLNSLSLNDCKNLEHILIDAPELLELSVKICPKIEDATILKIAKTSRKIEQIIVEDCPLALLDYTNKKTFLFFSPEFGQIKPEDLRKSYVFSNPQPIMTFEKNIQRQHVKKEEAKEAESVVKIEKESKSLLVTKVQFKIKKENFLDQEQLQQIQTLEAGVTTVRLENGELKDEDIRVLVKHRALKEIILCNQSLEGEFGFPANLTHLNLMNNFVGNRGIKVIVENSKNLIVLNLEGNRIESEGVKEVITLEKLEKLSLARNKIDDEGARILAQSFLPLEFLDLSHNQIRDPGAQSFLTRKKLISYLNFNGNYISDETIAQFAKKFTIHKRKGKVSITRSQTVRTFSVPKNTDRTEYQQLINKENVKELTPALRQMFGQFRIKNPSKSSSVNSHGGSIPKFSKATVYFTEKD